MTTCSTNLDTVQDTKAAEHCPVCGAGDFSATPKKILVSRQFCRHCGFEMCLSPDTKEPDVQPQPFSTRDLKQHEGANRPIWLRPVWTENAIDSQGKTLPSCQTGKLVIAGRMLEIGPDVNQIMQHIADILEPRGLVVIDVTKRPAANTHFFGRNSLQILLECHGFRLSARPWKWRLQWPGKTRRYLARKLH